MQEHFPSVQSPAVLVEISAWGDWGKIAASPCGLVLPFHYPATMEELDEPERDHFIPASKSWKPNWQSIPEFEDQNKVYSDTEDNVEDKAELMRVEQIHRQRRISVLQEAASSFLPTLTVFGNDSASWTEVNTFHISGPRLPQPPAPVSDIQILARLCKHTHSYVGQNRFRMEHGAITGVDFNGADTTDITIDLLRGVPNLAHLLRNLKKMSLKSTLVTDRSLNFLARELPHLEVSYSHYLKD